MSTFFVPLVSIDPPVADKGHWSGCDVVVQVYRGILPRLVCERCGDPLVRSLLALPLEVTAIYLLALGSLIALSVRKTSRVLTIAAGLGALLALGLGDVGTRSAFHETFYGPMGNHGNVHYGWLQLVLFSIMAGLCVVSLTQDFTDTV